MMGLEDRIKDEMYVDTESLLEDEFERAKSIFDIYEDNTVVLADDMADVGAKQKVLIHLVAWQYIAEADEELSAGRSYDYFYERIDAGDSTIRGYVGDFADESLVRENEDGDWELIVESISTVLDRIEAAAGSEEN
jgi:hypothetical protein